MPFQIDELDWSDIQKFVDRATKNKQNETRDKINDYITLVHIVHSDKPVELINSLKRILEPTDNDDLCDVKGLANLKAMRQML